MSRKKKIEELDAETPVVISAEALSLLPPIVEVVPDIYTPKPIPTPSPKELSIEAYCVIKHVPELHKAGMRAYAKANKTIRASLGEWENLFANY